MFVVNPPKLTTICVAKVTLIPSEQFRTYQWELLFDLTCYVEHKIVLKNILYEKKGDPK